MNRVRVFFACMKMFAWLIISACFVRKTFASFKPVRLVLACICTYSYVSVYKSYVSVRKSYVSRMLVVCIRMYPYFPYVTRMLPVCYS